MAGEQGEGSREGSSFLDHFLRRLDNKDAEPRVTATTSQSQASPSSSVAALVSHYDALSPNPTNPWQYLSNPTSPTSSQRDNHYNHLGAHSSLYSSGGHFQRDLVAEWMPEELEQERVASQAHNQSHGSNLVQRLPAREQVSNPDGANSSAGNGVEQTEANFLYEDAAAAWFGRSAGGYVRGDPDLAAASQRQGLYENFARLGTQSSDSPSVVPQFDGRDVDGEARMRSWERAMPSQYLAAPPGAEMDGTILPNRAPPLSDTGTPSDSIRSANSVGTPSNTSLSSGSGREDSDDEEHARVDPPGTSVTGDAPNSSGKRKTPEPSGEEGNDSARTSSEAELKQTSASLPPKKKLSFRKAREPRYAIKTRTDVDIMDDGFKWRKYGQKAVKNSPHPRNYYRCTTPQCPVRKRVERSREDPGLVITTYEGTHTHQTPGFRTPAPGEGYFGERPSGFGVGLFHNAGPRFPYPPEFSLAALYQLRTLQQTARSLQALAQHQIPGIPLGARFPGGDLQLESLRRAQQFLGLHDPTFGSVKQEPTFNFTANLRGVNHVFPFPGRHFQPPGCFDRTPMMRPQQMRPHPPRNLAPISDIHYPEFSPPPTDTDLVRRVLEAELSCGDGPNSNAEDIPNVDSSSPFNHGGPASPPKFASGLRSRVELERLRSLQPPSRPVLLRRRESAPSSTDSLVAAGSSSSQPLSKGNSLVDGLLQEMAKPESMELNPNVSR